MYFSKLPYIIYRDYPNFGYLTDNRNYGYDTASKSCIKIGERILSKVGSIFYSVLTEHPQSLMDISRKLSYTFQEISLQELGNDARDFFLGLSQDGFIKCSDSIESAIQPTYFSYSKLTPSHFLEHENEKISAFKHSWVNDFNLFRLHLSITNSCNERCVHCYFPAHDTMDIMSIELFLNIIEQCRELKVINITMSGGEPMINPNLAFFIKKCREYNLSINILSNLTLLTDSLIREFQASPLLSIQTSLYSMNELIHDSITRNKGSFLKTKKAIKILHSLNIPMQINCPIMKQNKDTYQEVLKWAKALNIEASSDYMLFGCFDGSRKNLNCRLELSEIESIIKYEHENDNTLNTNKKNIYPKDSVCPVCNSSLCISPSGMVYPCEGWQSYSLGNIKNMSLYEIWEKSSDVKKLRDLTLYDFPKCNNCLDKDYCSICLIRNVNESETLNYKDINPYFCSIAKIKRKIYSSN